MEAALVEPEVKAEAAAAGGGADPLPLPDPNLGPSAGAPVPSPAPVKQDEDEAKPPVMVSDEQIVASLRALLATADVATTTEKMLRKGLEQQLGCELSHKKALIREEVQAYINARQPPADEEEEEKEEEEDEAGADEAAARPAGRQQPACTLSPQLQAFLGGVETMPRTQVVKAIWDYIKAHGLQDPACRRNILPDARLGTVLKAPVTMFSMNKQLSAHVKTIPGGAAPGGGGSRPRARAPAARRKPGAGGGTGGGKARGGFAVPVRLSAAMAEVVGRETMTRADLTKWFWNYFRTKDLMDPENKRFVIADERLKRLFGEDRFLAFGIQRLVSKHVVKADGAAAGGGEDDDDDGDEGGGGGGEAGAGGSGEGVKEEEEEGMAAE